LLLKRGYVVSVGRIVGWGIKWKQREEFGHDVKRVGGVKTKFLISGGGTE